MSNNVWKDRAERLEHDMLKMAAELWSANAELAKARGALKLAYSRIDPMAEEQSTIDIIEAALAAKPEEPA